MERLIVGKLANGGPKRWPRAAIDAEYLESLPSSTTGSTSAWLTKTSPSSWN
jgi:hypothetical protein